MVDYSRHLLSYRFVYCKRAIPTPQSQEPCYYRIPDSFHCRYRRLGDLDVTPLCWPIAVALASSRDYGRRFALSPVQYGLNARPLKPMK